MLNLTFAIPPSNYLAEIIKSLNYIFFVYFRLFAVDHLYGDDVILKNKKLISYYKYLLFKIGELNVQLFVPGVGLIGKTPVKSSYC